MDIAFLVYDGFTTLDAIGPFEVLSRLPGATAKFVGIEKGPVATDTGSLTIMADYDLSEVPQPEVIVVPGGGAGTMKALGDERILAWLRQAHETSQWTTSVCTGALILGAAGILKDMEVTTHWFARDMLEPFGATYSEKRVIRNGKVITAAGVSAGIDMGLTLAAEIGGPETAKMIQLFIEYDPQPPFDSGSPAKASPETVAECEKFLAGGFG